MDEIHEQPCVLCGKSGRLVATELRLNLPKLPPPSVLSMHTRFCPDCAKAVIAMLSSGFMSIDVVMEECNILKLIVADVVVSRNMSVNQDRVTEAIEYWSRRR